jgi:vacuolar protein-sorting-associated protein 4
MAATNIPWSLDSAILRRFDKKIYIPLPDIQAREYLVKNKLKGLSENLSE